MIKLSGKRVKLSILKVLFGIMIATAISVQAAEPDIFEQPITAKFQNVELGAIFKQLSAETGVQIVYDKRISQKMFSGLYQGTPFLNVIQRLLSRENHTLTMDREQKILFIRSFGESQYTSTNISPGGVYLTDIGVPLDKLRSLHAKQTEEYNLSSNNMDEFLDELSMTRGELRRIQEEQSFQFEQEVQDADQYLTEVGMTRGQLQGMLSGQLADYERDLANDKMVLAEVGMTRGEQRKMLENQVASFEKQQQDDNEFLADINMTRGEHKRMLAQQSKKYEDRLTQ